MGRRAGTHCEAALLVLASPASVPSVLHLPPATQLSLAFSCSLLAIACGASQEQLLRRASSDLDCTEGQLQVALLDQQTRVASGCGRRATYVESCSDEAHTANCTWVLNSEVDSTAPSSGAPADPPAAENPSEPQRALIKESREADGSLKLKLYVRDEGSLLYLTARPLAAERRATLVWRIQQGTRSPQCEIKLVADGNRVTLEGGTTRAPHEQVTYYRSTLSFAALTQMAEADHVRGKLCEIEVSFDAEHLAKLRELVLRVREEQALSEEPASAATDRMPASEQPASDP